MVFIQLTMTENGVIREMSVSSFAVGSKLKIKSVRACTSDEHPNLNYGTQISDTLNIGSQRVGSNNPPVFRNRSI